MFDAGSGGSDVGTFDSGDDRSPERRQYTLKGVEADTIKLMRYAANKEGMKIGSWVSLRMREAAERALSTEKMGASISTEQPPVPLQVDLNMIQNFMAAIRDQQESTNRRFLQLERELHEITSGQRSMLSALLNNKCSE